ncbi:hypothetical protein AGABI1DRAFT_80653 [Agaricus bisporus var. burnettii JB137-S8]|uniref:Nuclear pore complex protein n=1 Tax=Agaricus bisporus var. burnettii (strain JB137-S8 / ATCC MYA-4627 / FGSC 10392) TaxID=597362 RepID=K5VKF9_AGABU|nr:uncharacterized protein AGABI1DRAFT_80653 [Agaricus bisporus var. burnettii JB137-S8]EKM74849.1 hypothetical protein AGABI1DRAFT_80653 [Agaricus bisporus var. burnettii JB137-S8]
MTESLFQSYADVLSLCQIVKDDLEPLLDPEIGFAPRIRQLCTDQIAEFEDDSSQEERELLKLEENTWGLLQALMAARKTELKPKKTPRELLIENPYTPTSTIAQALMQSSPLFSELIVVREWLQEIAPLPIVPEATTGYWKFTKYNVMQAFRTGRNNNSGGGGGGRDGLVREMDPDVLSREDGKTLAPDDASYDKSLIQALYGYIRAGQLEEAIELCRKAYQPWRAASIRGSLLFTWRALSTKPRDEDEEEDNEEPNFWQGNRNRRLWKITCTKAALNSALSENERILYAALVPTPQTSTVLKASCRTWEDHLWAQISIMCEEKESMEIGKLGGNFWEEGVEGVRKGVRDVSVEDEEREEQEWVKEVTETLESLKGVAVSEGPAADHAFHFSQLYIILNRTSQLLEAFARGLSDGSYRRDTVEYAPMCRFFAHLALYLQIIDVTVPPLATQTILECYLQVLEDAGERDLIAMYASALGDNAVERYALFLVSLALTADVNERRLALTRAKDHGLDMERVAIVTAERTIEKAFEVLPALKGPLPSVITRQQSDTESELFLLRSIEWTVFLDTTYDTALEQANVILRYFLASGRVHLAQKLLEMVPSDLAVMSEPEDRATEYLHYRQFFVIWEILEKVVECEAMNVPGGLSNEEYATWLNQYRELIDQAYEQITKLLTSEWLVADESISSERRRRELIRIRQIYVPELIIRLHSLLVSSRHFIPENLKSALELVNIVADSRYRIYEDFINVGGRSLSDYLGAVRQAVLVGMEGGGSDPLRILTV